MDDRPENIAQRIVALGRVEVCNGVTTELGRSLATLGFADQLRRAADRLSHDVALDARAQGASWREIGGAVGGITPQGAEHRFSPTAKERRSKAAKVEWAQHERRKP